MKLYFNEYKSLFIIRSTVTSKELVLSVKWLSRSIEMSATLRNLEGHDEASILREIQAALQGLKFGSVEITVHNGQVVQIERKEKFRLNSPSNKAN